MGVLWVEGVIWSQMETNANKCYLGVERLGKVGTVSTNELRHSL